LEPQARDYPGGKWEEEHSGAVATLARKAREYPGEKFDDAGTGEESNYNKEVQEFIASWGSSNSEGGTLFYYPRSVYCFYRSEMFKTYNKSFYRDDASKRRNEDNRLRAVHDVFAVAVYMYTGPFYAKINKALRSPDCAKSEKPEQCKVDQKEVSDLIRTVLTAWWYLPPPTTNTLETRYLYRGSKELMPTILKKDEKWQTEEFFEFEDEGFMSTTMDKDVAVNGKGRQNVTKEQIKYVLKVDCQACAAAASTPRTSCCQNLARDVHKLSKYYDEKEVIFPPGLPFDRIDCDKGEPNYITIAPARTSIIGWGYDLPPLVSNCQ